MEIRGFVHRAALAVAVVAASCWVVPNAFAHSHVHVGIGIVVPGVTIDVGNCWRCGYRVAPPVYYRPVYPPPGYYVPPRVYYRYGYYAPYYHWHGPRHYHRRSYRYHGPRQIHGHYRHRNGHYYHRGHHHYGHR